MFYSHCLLSRKGPLRAVWVAAYYFKKLKKSQIYETDISSSVDRLLQDEFEALTYRVLAYLLLGVVRIYSKKVEYLYEDCNEVLVQLKDFVAKKEYKAQLEIPSASYISITLPERFELDAFDLEILEDTNEKNVRSQEEITLKDVKWDSQGSGQFYLNKYHSEDFDVSCSTCPIDLSKEDELEVQFMDIDKEAGTSIDLDKLDEIIEKIRCDDSFKEGSLFCGTLFSPEEEPPDPVKSQNKNYHTDEKNEEVSEVASVENHMSREANSGKNDCRFSPEECVNLHSEDEAEPHGPCGPCGEDQTNQEKTNGQKTEPVENIMQPMEVENSVSILEFEAITTKVQDDSLPHVDLGEPLELVQPSGVDDQPDVEQKILPEETCSKKRKRKVVPEDLSLSLTVNATPRTKLSDASGFTPKYMLIPTPANKESARFSKKRRCLFDDMIVYPNNVFKQWINDTSDLVRERKKGFNNARAAQTMRYTTNSVYDFCKPLVLCPPELIPLHYGKKLKVQEQAEMFKTPEKKVVPAPIKLPENLEVSAPIELSENLEVPVPPISVENIEVSTLPVGRSSEQRDIAPQTPVRCSTTLRSFGRLKHGSDDIEDEPVDEVVCAPTEKDDKEPATSLSVEASTHPVGNEEKYPSVRKEQEVNSAEKCNKEPAASLSVEAYTHLSRNEDKDPSVSRDQEVNSSGKDEKEPSTSIDVEACAHPIGNEEKGSSVSKDQEADLNFMSKDEFSCDSDIQGQDGWSERTRLVAKFLSRSFLDKKNGGEEEKVNLSSIARGKTRKETARLFYEILVLKTKDFVEVEQDSGFNDILVSKAARYDQTSCAYAI